MKHVLQAGRVICWGGECFSSLGYPLAVVLSLCSAVFWRSFLTAACAGKINFPQSTHIQETLNLKAFQNENNPA
jgi:hypothetical protein